MRAVIAGPFTGEFGWELMSWQGYVRAQAQNADIVVVCSTKGLRPLYADLNPIYLDHAIQGRRDCMSMNPCETPHLLSLAECALDTYERSFKQAGYEIVRLKPKGGIISLDKQKFIAYGDAIRATKRGETYSIVLHARNRQEVMQSGGHNYPLDKWAIIVEDLKSKGHKLASIGTPLAAHHVPGTTDLRGMPLHSLVDILAAAKLVIGPSSGPMHLASLCKTPHVVWAVDRYQPSIKATNKERYEVRWNPLKTPATVLLEPAKGPSIKPEAILDAIYAVLEK